MTNATLDTVRELYAPEQSGSWGVEWRARSSHAAQTIAEDYATVYPAQSQAKARRLLVHALVTYAEWHKLATIIDRTPDGYRGNGLEQLADALAETGPAWDAWGQHALDRQDVALDVLRSDRSRMIVEHARAVSDAYADR